jgi:excisionase family DNA binding protein
MPRPRKKQQPIDLQASPVGTLYTTAQVAQLVSVSPRTVQRWIREKRLPAVMVGGTYRVRAEALREFVKEM